jgi:hypothetical protein
VESKQKAQKALSDLKIAVYEFVKANEGLDHSKIVKALGLESDFEGKHKNYLSWSILGLLVNEGAIRYESKGPRKAYFSC